ncbi:MAG: hypothetical protein ACK4MD_11590 [Demequina sp.]
MTLFIDMTSRTVARTRVLPFHARGRFPVADVGNPRGRARRQDLFA